MTTLTEYAQSALDISYASGVSSQEGGPTPGSSNSIAWSNVSNIEGASDSVYATCNYGGGSSDAYSNVLLGYNYNFSSIAGGSTISDVSCHHGQVQPVERHEIHERTARRVLLVQLGQLLDRPDAGLQPASVIIVQMAHGGDR